MQPAPAASSPAEFADALDRVARHLAPDSGDAKSQAAAAVTITLMLQQTQLPADLSAIVGQLIQLLDSAEVAVQVSAAPACARSSTSAVTALVEADSPPQRSLPHSWHGLFSQQRNAAAALGACLESSDTAVESCVENGAAQRATALLKEGGTQDASLQLNLVVLLGTLCEANDRTCQDVLDAGGAEQLLRRADPQASEQLREAAVDGLCKLASSSAAAKDAAAAAGAVPALAGLLGGDGSAEVGVRALLCLGMLVGGSPARQEQLAGTPGAVAALLRLMRQHDDGDCQQIAAGVFRELAGNGEAKQAIAAALKEQQAADAAAPFVR